MDVIRKLALVAMIAVLVTSALGAGATAADVSTTTQPTELVAQQDGPGDDSGANESGENDTGANRTDGDDVGTNETSGNDTGVNETGGNDTDTNETTPEVENGSPADDGTDQPLENDTVPPTDNETVPPNDDGTDSPGEDAVEPSDDDGEPPADGETGPTDGEPAPGVPDSAATVTVTGTGEASAEPDRAIVHVSVVATGPNASEAAAALAENASTLRSALEDSNLTDEVRTTDYRIFERRDGERATNESDARIASHSFAVGVEDPNAAGDVIDLAVENGATEIHGIEFTLSESRSRQVRADAIEHAVGDARNQADAVAASTDLSLGPIHSVRVGSGGVGPISIEAADAGTVIDVGEVTVTASVEITYRANASADD